MKPIFYVFALSVCLLSCKKGKELSHEVAIQFVTTTSSEIYPEENFPLFNPYDLNEIPQAPSYAHDYSSEQIAIQFNLKLNSLLNKNNIILQADTTNYVLYITAMKLSESIKRESYIDSCSWNNATAYVYKSSLKFKVTATLYKHGIFIDSWAEEANSTEVIRSKRDNCNKPKICPIIRGTNCLINQVAKEFRVRISKRMYELEN